MIVVSEKRSIWLNVRKDVEHFVTCRCLCMDGDLFERHKHVSKNIGTSGILSSATKEMGYCGCRSDSTSSSPVEYRHVRRSAIETWKSFTALSRLAVNICERSISFAQSTFLGRIPPNRFWLCLDSPRFMFCSMTAETNGWNGCAWFSWNPKDDLGGAAHMFRISTCVWPVRFSHSYKIFHVVGRSGTSRRASYASNLYKDACWIMSEGLFSHVKLKVAHSIEQQESWQRRSWWHAGTSLLLVSS